MTRRGMEPSMRYKVFGRHTGLRVSELFLGAGMFGTGWGHGAEPEESRRIFDGFQPPRSYLKKFEIFRKLCPAMSGEGFRGDTGTMPKT